MLIYIIYLGNINLFLLLSLFAVLFFVFSTLKYVDKTVNVMEGDIIFIDYFTMRRLDIILAIIFIYIMMVYTVLTIIFSQNSIYSYTRSNTFQCDPLLYYLGSRKGCMRAPAHQEGMKNEKDDTFLEKMIHIYSVLTFPIFKIYQFCVQIIVIIKEFRDNLERSMKSCIIFYLDKQHELFTKWHEIFIQPITLRINDTLYKEIQTVFDRYK